MATDWTTDRVRATFVAFFVEKLNHTHVPSSPVVPAKDPTLLFANSGMTQFKPIFLNEVNPQTEPELARLKRAANSQKCIRAGGKHNDLADVGKDTYHHTFFEMLGNWSFGDYFKKEAIDWAWELLTQVYGLDPERLYATYYAGNARFNVPVDEEARELWLRYLPANRVLPFEKENFWEMGDTGPCGPCSEIHYDRIGGRDAASLVNMDDPDVIEIWNLVFMQYNRVSADRLDPLPHKHVDTGAGLERVTSILQQKRSNYDIDLFQGLFRRIQELTGARPYLGHVGAEDVDFIDTAYRVVADHARTLTFSIADGCRPSNTGRGYVVRRVLRRAVYYFNEILKGQPGTFRNLIAGVADEMKSTYGYLQEHVPFITQLVGTEEDSFNRTLKLGIRRFEAATSSLKPGDTIPGAFVFKLYDTFGFPVDLTTRMAEQRQLLVDEAGFEKKTAEAWQRNAKTASTNQLLLNANALEHLRTVLNANATVDAPKYDPEDLTTSVVALFIGGEPAGEFVDSVSSKADAPLLVGVVTESTNFYAEQGGQIFDTGVFTLASGTELEVSNVQLFGEYVLHSVELPAGTSVELKRGDHVTLVVDHQRRSAIMANHTATHMVNHSLRQVIGGESAQAGSLVQADQFRFDFKHSAQLTADESERVEALVRDLIHRDLPVNFKEVPKELATSIHGVQQLFSERYPDIVRVVAIGVSVDDLLADPKNTAWPQYSIEFCSGTHIARTSDAREFTITSCRGLEAGVRRLEALTGEPAVQAIARVEQLAAQVAAVEASLGSQSVAVLDRDVRELEAKLNDALVPYHSKIALRERVDRLRERALELGKEAMRQSQQAALERAADIARQLQEAPQPFWVEVVPGGQPKVLSSIITQIQTGAPDVAVLLISPDLEKKTVAVVSSVPKPGNLKANDWAKHVATTYGGNGGGKPNTAQAKFSDISKVEDAERTAREYATAHL